jgi:hypothetical protein
VTSRGDLHERREAKLDKMRIEHYGAAFVRLDGSRLGGQTDGEPLRRNPPAQAKIEAGGRNDLRIGKLALGEQAIPIFSPSRR